MCMRVWRCVNVLMFQYADILMCEHINVLNKVISVIFILQILLLFCQKRSGIIPFFIPQIKHPSSRSVLALVQTARCVYVSRTRASLLRLFCNLAHL